MDDAITPFIATVPLMGVAIIILAVWLAGGGARRLLDDEILRRCVTEDLPGVAIGDIVISGDGAAALATVVGESGLVAAIVVGDKVAVRRLDRGDVEAVSRDGGKLVIATSDFGCPRVALVISNSMTESWWGHVAALTPVQETA
jgi:hypothetical protein